MPQRCSVPFCCNYGGHQFPKDKQRRFQWRVAIKRLDPLTKKLWEPNDRDVVCHLHFVASDYKDTSVQHELANNRFNEDKFKIFFSLS